MPLGQAGLDTIPYAFLERFTEGTATPEGHNCLIDTLCQLGGETPDYAAIRRQLGIAPPAPGQPPAMIGLTEANPLARRLGLRVTVYGIGAGGEVGLMGYIGTETGRPVYVLHFGAHYIPLWPK